jgi:hypothetical protein
MNRLKALAAMMPLLALEAENSRFIDYSKRPDMPELNSPVFTTGSRPYKKAALSKQQLQKRKKAKAAKKARRKSR